MASSFPSTRQINEMDCGPSCLHMICAHYGRDLSREDLRGRTQVTREGVSLKTLADVAEDLGFRCLPVAVTPEVLVEDVPLPCILHWKDNHFVVLHRIAKGRYHVADPGIGKVVYGEKEFLRDWLKPSLDGSEPKGMALALEITPSFHEHERSDLGEEPSKQGLGFLLRYLRPQKQLIVQLAIGLVASSLLAIFLPLLTQGIVDQGVDSGDLRLVGIFVIAYLVVAAANLGVQMIQGFLMLHVGSRVSISLISDFLRKLLRLPLMFFETRTPGDIVQRVDDHDRITAFLTARSFGVLFALVNAFVFTLVLASYSMLILVLLYVGLILNLLWILAFMRRRRLLDHKTFEVNAEEKSKLFELVGGIQEIRLHNLERTKRWEWESLGARRFRLHLRELGLENIQTAGTFFFTQVAMGIASFLAARAVIEGDMTLGMMMATQMIVAGVAAPLGQLVGFIHSYQDAKLSLERMQEIHVQEDEVDSEATFIPSPPGLHDMVLKEVSFTYPGAHSEPALDGLDCVLPAGKTTAIVGSSGSGKSTLLKLLAALHLPGSGTIHVGGVALNQINPSDWRSRCGVVMQDGYLFPDSLEQNITCGVQDPDRLRLMAVIELAHLEGVVSRLSSGVKSKLGPDGMGLSGGERQRLLLARALYQDPEYLFLDEATSALDSNTEAAVMRSLESVRSDRTCVIIAHRLSTVRRADQILVLEEGSVVERGTHETLLALKGRYHQLVSNQLPS